MPLDLASSEAADFEAARVAGQREPFIATPDPLRGLQRGSPARCANGGLRPVPSTLAPRNHRRAAVIGGNVPGSGTRPAMSFYNLWALRQKIGAAAREAVLEAENLNEPMDAD